jgi:pyridoxamine 5'-phosphate oxidase family protein
VARFSDPELDYLRTSTEDGQRANLTIAGKDGAFRLVPVRVSYDEAENAIEIAAPEALHVGINLPPADVAEVQLVVDDLASIEPWQPRGIEVTGAAEALTGPPLIRIRVDAVRSWGVET